MDEDAQDWNAPPTMAQAATARRCGHPGEVLMHNPYAAEVRGIITWEWLCPDCKREALMDI